MGYNDFFNTEKLTIFFLLWQNFGQDRWLGFASSAKALSFKRALPPFWSACTTPHVLVWRRLCRTAFFKSPPRCEGYENKSVENKYIIKMRSG
jgi:hypothetical protein